MILEVFYLIGFIAIMALVVLAAAFVSAAGATTKQVSVASSGGWNTGGIGSGTQNTKITTSADTVADAADTLATAMLWVGIGCIVAEIPRLYYLCKLCGYVCCGGKVRDTLADRQGIVMAMKALMVNQILSALIIVIVVAAVGAPFSGGVIQTLLSFVINCLFAAWWIMDLNKWVALKQA